MMTTKLTALLALLISQSKAWDFISTSGAAYPYAVHLPTNPSTTPPPAILNLHGSGARGSPDETEVKAGYDAVGGVIRRFESGNTSEECVLAGTEFLVIAPVAPMSDVKEWDLAGIISVLQAVNANTSQAYDPNRLFVTGYSMGSHGGWHLLTNNDTAPLFAGAALAAGDNGPYGLEIPASRMLPIQSYAGTLDTSGTLAGATAVHNKLIELGDTNAQLVVFNGLDHNHMSTAPFGVDAFNFLLSIGSVNATSTSTTATSASVTAIGITPTPLVSTVTVTVTETPAAKRAHVRSWE